MSSDNFSLLLHLTKNSYNIKLQLGWRLQSGNFWLLSGHKIYKLECDRQLTTSWLNPDLGRLIK